MTDHVSPSEVDAFLRGGLPPDRVLAVGRHLSQCGECARSSASAPAQERLVEQLLRDDDDRHTAGAAPRPRRVWPFAMAAAAAIVIAILIVPLVRKDEPPPHDTAHTTQAPPREDAQERAWRTTVERAVRAGMAMPAELRELAPRRGTLRGNGDFVAPQLSPRGTVVEETRPTFEWSAIPNARYRVVVFEGTREAASSGTLEGTHWRPETDLARGRSYAWQLHVITPNGGAIAPPPNEGPAAVRILDAGQFDALQDARRRRPDDHLLLGILCAQAGVLDTAEAELRLAAKTDARAAALLETVHGWRSVVQTLSHPDQ